MSKYRYDALATVGEYKAGDGTKKKRYAKVGVVFEDDQGRLSLKLDTVPIGPGWSGYIQFFEPRRDESPSRLPSQGSTQSKQSTGSYAESGQLGEGEDIPF